MLVLLSLPSVASQTIISSGIIEGVQFLLEDIFMGKPGNTL